MEENILCGETPLLIAYSESSETGPERGIVLDHGSEGWSVIRISSSAFPVYETKQIPDLPNGNDTQNTETTCDSKSLKKLTVVGCCGPARTCVLLSACMG